MAYKMKGHGLPGIKQKKAKKTTDMSKLRSKPGAPDMKTGSYKQKFESPVKDMKTGSYKHKFE